VTKTNYHLIICVEVIVVGCTTLRPPCIRFEARQTFDLKAVYGHRYDAASYHVRSEAVLVLRPLGHVGTGENDIGILL
jgi:hypothetical protein